MPTHSSTVHGLSILADPSQDILNCAVACTVPEETPGSTVCSFLGRQNKTKQNPISHQHCLTKDSISTFPK